jgi:hypothetical protein
VSDPESFLSRWARLKRESNRSARPGPGSESRPESESESESEREPVSGVAPADTVKAAAVGIEAGAVAVEPTRGEVGPSPAPPFDLASLPSVASITQASDIRQFLQAGVPAELVRAALRAAWVTDPTIRDFIGIADSQWDFNDPTSMPGFGPLEAADGARAFAQRSVARVNEVAGGVERMPELATRAAVDAANLPREGQVDRVWLSAGMTEQGGSRAGSASVLPQTHEFVTAPESAMAPESVTDPAGASDSSDLRAGPRVHGTALPKART